MSRGLDGKHAFITGGSSGIGAALVTRLEAEGVATYVADTAAATPSDVSDEASVAAAVERAVDRFEGQMDLVFSNAGMLRAGRVEDMPIRVFDQVIAVNLRGAFLTAKYTIPHLRRRGGGAMVFTGSTASLVGARSQGAYSASKAGIISLARCLADELAHDSIRVNSVCPGWVATSFNDPVWDDLGGVDSAESQAVLAAIPMHRQATPDEVAGVMVFLGSDDASYITGETIVVDGGLLGIR